MESKLNNLRQSVRDAAYRAGLPRFWQWWTAELARLIPAAWRGAIQRRRLHPVIEFSDTDAVFWRPEFIDGKLKLAAATSVSLRGEPAAVAAAGAAAVATLPRLAYGARAVAPKVIVALSPRQVLRKDLLLPAAVEENLVQALAYDLDRHTPFRPEQLYFDAGVTGRDLAKKTIRVDWAAALKTVVDSARRQVEGWGAQVEAVVPGPMPAMPTRLNLIPGIERPGGAAWRRWEVWAPVALGALLLLAVGIVPLAQKREYVIALNQQTELARERAEAADALRQQLERLQGDYNFVLARKFSYPSTLQVLDDVTRLLPDDTWLTQLELKTSAKGKDTQREMLLRGESGNAGKLISLLEDSLLVEQATPRSPTTKIQPGPGEVFDLGAQLRHLPPPAPAPVETVPEAPPPPPPVPARVQGAPASRAAPPAGAPAAAAGSPTTPAGNAPAAPPAGATTPAASAPARPAGAKSARTAATVEAPVAASPAAAPQAEEQEAAPQEAAPTNGGGQ